MTVVRKAITRDAIRYIPGLRIFQTETLRVRARTGSRCDKARSQREQAVEKGEQPVQTTRSVEATTLQSADQTRASPRRPRRRRHDISGSDLHLLVPIKHWGDQKVLRYYRQVLASLAPNDAAEFAKFRAMNAAVEARLWRKLPHRMEEIGFLYGVSRVSSEGEGTPK